MSDYDTYEIKFLICKQILANIDTKKRRININVKLYIDVSFVTMISQSPTTLN